LRCELSALRSLVFGARANLFEFGGEVLDGLGARREPFLFRPIDLFLLDQPGCTDSNSRRDWL
jgi:hypothetical protein